MKKVFYLLIMFALFFVTSACNTNHEHEFIDGKCSCGAETDAKYKVKFIDHDGSILKEEEVNKNSSATAPSDPERFGYTFAGWDCDFSNVTSNLDVHALYDAMTFTVRFYDFYGKLLKEELIKTDQTAHAPEAPGVIYHEFTGWDMDFSKVQSNMSINPLYEYRGGVLEMDNPNYWLQELSKKHDIFDIIMTKEDIDNFNESVYSDYIKTEVVNVCGIARVLPKDTVLQAINAYSNMNKYPVYNDSTKSMLTTSEKEAILENRALDQVSDTVSVRFGLVCDFAWLRSYPTRHYSNNYEMDRFQETSLNVGEEVAIYHESLDGNWYFVQAENYNGWIEKQYVGICSFEEMYEFKNATDRLVVISDYVAINSVNVRMGQSFPLTENTKDSYQISFPTRKEDGTLELKTTNIIPSDDYSVGYLEYNYANMINQAFKLLGIDYSWGDKFITGRDCSSTMNAIFRSFGMVMPRNTSNQLAIPTYGKKVNGLSPASMKKYLPGTMIFTSSHVMLYIGENSAGEPYLLHNTTSGNGECILQSLQNYGGNRMIAVLRPYNIN